MGGDDVDQEDREAAVLRHWSPPTGAWTGEAAGPGEEAEGGVGLGLRLLLVLDCPTHRRIHHARTEPPLVAALPLLPLLDLT